MQFLGNDNAFMKVTISQSLVAINAMVICIEVASFKTILFTYIEMAKPKYNEIQYCRF